MRFQINRQLNSLQGKPDKQTVKFKNQERNWETVEGTVNTLLEEIRKGQCFRLCVKDSGNAKDDISEVWGIGLDIDKGGFSIAATLANTLLQQVSHIFYISSSGILGEDATPHRLIFPFRNPVSGDFSACERVSKLLHSAFTETSKHSTFDGGRLWFSTSPQNMVSLEYIERAKFLDDLFLTEKEPVTVGADVAEITGDSPTPKKVLSAPKNGGSKAPKGEELMDMISIVSNTPESPVNGHEKGGKKNKGKTIGERLDIFWSEYAIGGSDINANITAVIGYDANYRITTRKTKGDMQLDGGHWEGSLSNSKGNNDSTTLTLTKEGNFIFYDRRNGIGSNFVTFLYNAYGYSQKARLVVTTRPSNAELLKFTKERCEAIGLEAPQLSLAAEEIWQYFLADSVRKIFYMDHVKAYAVYKTVSVPMINTMGTDYHDRAKETQQHWGIVAPKDLPPIIDAWNYETFGSNLTPKLLRDVKTLAELGHARVEKMSEFPLDQVLPVKGGKLWHFVERRLMAATHEKFYWNPSAMPWLEGEKEEEIGQDFIDLLKLITPEKEHCKIPYVLDWMALWLAGRAYNSQFALYFWGEGGAGKSTICQWLKSMVGKDHIATRENDLLRPDLRFGNERLLQTSRMIIDEFKGDNIKSVNLPFLKDLIAASKTAVIDNNGAVVPGVYTGGTSIKVEIKFAGEYTGEARLGVLINGQNLPVVPESDAGWPRRFLFLQFQLALEETGLFEKIGSYLPYLRSWFLKKDLLACERRLEKYIRSQATLQHNRSLLHGNSPMGEFITSYVTITPGDYPTPFGEVYKAWAAYCDLQKIRPGAIGKFLEQLEASLKAMGEIKGSDSLYTHKRDTNNNQKKFLSLTINSH